MKQEKAYKLLSMQEGISNNKAKELIDSGLVYLHGKKITIARGLADVSSKFKVLKQEREKILHEDNEKLVLNKPSFTTTENLAKKYNLKALHRLDKETSGVFILSKDEDFRIKAIEEFRKLRVEKEYMAIVSGKFAEEMTIDAPIMTFKTKGGAVSKISYDKGKEAISIVEPLMIVGKNSLVKVTIKTGRTHQIRVHLSFAGYPILGDMKYGKLSSERLMLHCSKMILFDESFKAELPYIFKKYGFSYQ